MRVEIVNEIICMLAPVVSYSLVKSKARSSFRPGNSIMRIMNCFKPIFEMRAVYQMLNIFLASNIGNR